MRTMLRSKVTLLFMMLGMLLAFAGIAYAGDMLSADGDALTANNDETNITLGTVQPGAAIKASDGNDFQVSFRLQCAVQGGNNSHVDQNKIVKLNYSAADSTIPAGATVSATDATIQKTPNDNTWPTDGGACPNDAPVLQDNGNSVLTMTAPKAGGNNKSIKVTYNATIHNVNPDGSIGSLYAADMTDSKTLQSGFSRTIQYNFNVAQVAPVISSVDGDATAVVGDQKTYTVNASDANEDALTYTNTVSGPATFVTGTSTTSTPKLNFTGTGPVTLTSTVKDSTNLTSTPKTTTITVNSASQSTTTTVASDNNPSTYGDPVKFTATVTGATSNPSGVGNVTFKDGTTTLCNAVALTGNKADCTTSALAAGDHSSITAVYSGGTGFQGSTGTAAKQVVNKKELTVNGLSAQGKAYDGNDTATITGTPTLVGKVGTDIVSLTGTPTGTFASKNVANNIAVAVSGLSLTGSASGNYTLTQPSLSANITKAPLTVTAKDKTKTYGDANPAFDFDYSGFVNSETKAIIDTEPTCSSAATATSPVSGSPYAITCSGGADDNYSFTYVNGKLTVDPKAATVTANSKTITYGQADPTFDFQTSGVLASDSLTGVSCGVSGAHADAGSYDITCSGNTNTNYNVTTYNKGTLTIEQATPVVNITWSNSTYNGSANAASASVTGVGGANLGDADSLTYYSGNTASGTPLSDAPTNAGTYTVKAVFNATTNYKSNFATKTITIDKATPQITWSNPVAIDYGTLLSSTQLNAQADVSGSFQYSPAAGTKLLAGTHTLTANFTPTDTANYNNVNGTTVQIVVKPLSFGNGFYQPVDNRILNGVKGGSTVPMKFELFQSLSGTELKSTDAIKSTSTTKATCDSAPALGEDAIEEYTTGNTSLRFDASGDQFILNWQAPKATASAPVGTCYRVTIVANDGSATPTTLMAMFKIK